MSRWILGVALLAVTTWSLPARAQLPVFLTDTEEPAPPEASPVAAPPPAVAAPPPAVAAPPPPLAPAKAEVIGFGQHPYDDDDDDVPAVGPRRTWYGWQTLIVDGASLSSVLLGASLERSSGSGGGALVGAGLLGYEFGPGIVHFVHRNPGRGFASFGVRLGMPLAGAFLGASLFSNCDGYQCEGDGAGAGFLLGMVGAIAIDAAVFAYDDQRSRAPRAGPRLLPLASLRPGHAWLGIGGEL